MRARKQSRCLSFSNTYLPFMHMSVTARTTSQTLAEGTLGWAGHIGSAQNDNVVLSARNIPASKKKVSTRNTKIKAPEYLTWEGWMSGHRDLPCNKGTASQWESVSQVPHPHLELEDQTHWERELLLNPDHYEVSCPGEYVLTVSISIRMHIFIFGNS